MEASKVNFSEGTKIALSSPLMKRKTKSELRQRRLIEILSAKPSGQPTLLKELTDALNFKNSRETWAWMNLRVKSGLVRQERLGKGSGKSPNGYYLVGEVKTIEQPKVEKDNQNITSEPREVVKSTSLDSNNVLTIAREWSWLENSDSLREFCKYLLEQK